MSILINKPLAKCVTFDKNDMWVEFSDGRKLCIPLAYFPRLLKASPSQRKKYIISGGGTGLHWEDIDEDILVENLLFGIGDYRKIQQTNITTG
jgi:hypothetical protein